MTPCLHCDPSSTHISALLALRLFFIFAPPSQRASLQTLTANVLSKPFLPPRLREHARLWLWGLGEGTTWLVSYFPPGFCLVRSSGSISREPRQSGSHGTRTGHTARAFDVLAERAVHIPKGSRCRGGEHVCGLGSTLTASHVLHLMHAPGAAPRERTPTTTPDRNDHHPEVPRLVEHIA